MLYALVAALTAAFAVPSPGRTSIYLRIMRRDQMPAANALSVFAMNASMIVGPAAMLAAGDVLTREQALWVGLVAMAVAGGSDSVSAVFRTTILQSATPDHLRGRLQGVFIVVVAGGPRLGELLGGFVAENVGEGMTAVIGGFACVAAIVVLAKLTPSFLRYDARNPTP